MATRKVMLVMPEKECGNGVKRCSMDSLTTLLKRAIVTAMVLSSLPVHNLNDDNIISMQIGDRFTKNSQIVALFHMVLASD
jgi:ABC-type enterochelin transport system permease subunit